MGDLLNNTFDLLNLNNELTDVIKSKKIFIMFQDFDIESGGVCAAVFKKSNYLVNKGYDVTFLNMDDIKDFDNIIEFNINSKLMSPKIEFINIFQFYCDLNSNGDLKTVDIDSLISENVEKIINTDQSITLNYYNNKTFEKLVKQEKYIDNCLIYKKVEESDKEEFFTKDGFLYLSIIAVGSRKEYCLNMRDANSIKFKNVNGFLYNFLDEICSLDNKPFLMCESTLHWYHMHELETDVYKIGVLHGNPFIVKGELSNNVNKYIKHFKFIDNLDALVLLTRQCCDDVEKDFNQKPIVVIPNYILDDLINEDEILEKNLNSIKVFTRIAPEKQLDHLIKAFKIVGEEYDNVILEIYGRALSKREIGAYNKLTDLVSNLGLQSKIFFRGHVEDVNSLMKETLFTVSCSKHEGLPFVILESMSNGTPVICYDYKYGPRDLITDGVDGIIIEKDNIDLLAENMLNLLKNPQMAIEMGEKARYKIKTEFSETAVGKQWEELLLSIYVKNELQYKDKLLEDNLALVNENKKFKKENKNLKKFKSSILSSSSWRITKPLRKINALFKKIF